MFAVATSRWPSRSKSARTSDPGTDASGVAFCSPATPSTTDRTATTTASARRARIGDTTSVSPAEQRSNLKLAQMLAEHALLANLRPNPGGPQRKALRKFLAQHAHRLGEGRQQLRLHGPGWRVPFCLIAQQVNIGHVLWHPQRRTGSAWERAKRRRRRRLKRTGHAPRSRHLASTARPCSSVRPSTSSSSKKLTSGTNRRAARTSVESPTAG